MPIVNPRGTGNAVKTSPGPEVIIDRGCQNIFAAQSVTPKGEASLNCFTGCSPCQDLLLIDAFLLALAFVAGRVVGRESGADHFTDEKVHRNRWLTMLVVLAVVLIMMLVFGMLSLGIVILVAIAFCAGFIWSRSKVNFNHKVSDFQISYNTF